MANKWIIEILDDLKSFAQENEMPDLARQLERSLEIAHRDVPTKGRALRVSKAIKPPTNGRISRH